MNRWQLALTLTLFAGLLRAAEPSNPEAALPVPEQLLPGLDAILQTVVRQSPRMLNRALDLEIAENNRLVARAGLLPTAASYARVFGTRDDRSDLGRTITLQKTYYDVNVNQPIFYWGERRNTARIGLIQEKIAQRQYRDGYRLFAQELRAQYLRLIVQKMSVARARFYLDYARRQLKAAEERAARGNVAAVVKSAAEQTVSRAQLDLERAEFDYETARATFARLAGLPSVPDEQIPDSIPVVTPAPKAAEQLAAGFTEDEYPTANPDAYTLREQIAVEELNYKIQKVRLRPKFSLVAGVNTDQQSFTVNVARKYRITSLYGGLQLSWNIFDGFAANATARSSLARRRQLENQYRDLAQSLGQQTRNQLKLLDFSARYMALTDQGADSAKSSIQTRQDDLKRGVATEDDVELLRLAEFDVRIAACNNRIAYLIQAGDFLGTLGRDPVLNNLPNDANFPESAK